MTNKVPLEIQKIKGCHSTISPGLVTLPQPESPKNRGSRCTQRPLAPDLLDALSRAKIHSLELRKHMVWGWGSAGRFFVKITCKHRRTTHTLQCNPGIYCLACFPVDRIYNAVKHNGEQILICGQLWKRCGKNQICQTVRICKCIVLAAEKHLTTLEMELLTFIREVTGDSTEIGFHISGDVFLVYVRLN